MDEDAQWFADHLDRKAHIRQPRLQRVMTSQRAVAFVPECQGEFWSLGPHEKARRRILLTRVDVRGEPIPDNKVLKIPFLAFSDETIEDRDDILLPLIFQIMKEAVS